MLELLISVYCNLAVEINIQRSYVACDRNVRTCVVDHNEWKYFSSQWLDVPTEKMSQESFQECVK